MNRLEVKQYDKNFDLQRNITIIDTLKAGIQKELDELKVKGKISNDLTLVIQRLQRDNNTIKLASWDTDYFKRLKDAICGLHANMTNRQLSKTMRNKAGELYFKLYELLTKEKDSTERKIEENKIKGAVIKIRTEFENLDVRTNAYATIKNGETILVDNELIASGPVDENTSHSKVELYFKVPIAPESNPTIQIFHPGISSNNDPHWRMTFTIQAIMGDNTTRGMVYDINQSGIVSNHRLVHLNFEGSNRNTNPITFFINNL